MLTFAREGGQVPHRAVVSSELARLFSVLSHPNRVRIVEEINRGELCVNTLQERLGISHTSVSQQLSVLRTSRLVVERKVGRKVFYHLKNPELAAWILSGSKFICPDPQDTQNLVSAIEEAKETWGDKGAQVSETN